MSAFLLIFDSSIAAAAAGGWGSNYSGDIFLAFSTAHEIPRENTQSWTPNTPAPIEVLDTETINALFEATFEATEEAICKRSSVLWEGRLYLTDLRS